MVRLGGRDVSSDAEMVAVYTARVAGSGFSPRTMFYRDSEQYSEKLAAFAAELEALPPGKCVLDVGCGFGGLLEYFRPQGKYIGVDLVPEFVDEAKRRWPDEEFRLCAASSLDEEVQVAVLAGVLSSVPHPMGLLSSVLSLLPSVCLFDFTVSSRLPSRFRDLNRLDIASVRKLLSGHGYAVDGIRDQNRSWLIVRATRRATRQSREVGSLDP